MNTELQQNAYDGESSSFVGRTLRVTALADEWGSSKGGLSTLNRELVKGLARQPDVVVTLLLPQYSEKEEKEAKDHGVILATPKAIHGIDDAIQRLSFPRDDLDIDFVIGHGQKLGPPASAIAEQRHCKRVHIVHTASEELSMFKKNTQAIARGAKKRETEVVLCEAANIVVAIGPKLTEAIAANLRPYHKDEDVVNITPGIFPEFLKLKQANEELGKFRVLVFGRGDSDDFELKGYDIAAEAVERLKDKSYNLLFVGAPDGKEEEVKDNLLKCGISRSQLTVRSYLESRVELAKLFCEADLAIMPSRTEGFGLAALEALSAGLPVLVSDNSGFGQALKNITFGSMCVLDSDDAEDWGKAIKCVKEKKRQIRLDEARSLRSFYNEEYSWETQCAKLVEKMRQLKSK